MTTREQVAALLQLGRTDKEIAREIGRNESVIGYHVMRLMAATGARNRTECAVRLIYAKQRAA